MKRWTLVIGGRSVDTTHHSDVINPSTGEPRRRNADGRRH